MPVASRYVGENLDIRVDPSRARPARYCESDTPRKSVLIRTHLDIDACHEGTVCTQRVRIKVGRNSCRCNRSASWIHNITSRSLSKGGVEHTTRNYEVIGVCNADSDKAVNTCSLNPGVEIKFLQSKDCV